MPNFQATLKREYIAPPEFSGVGLDDLKSSGTYTDTKKAIFTVIIDDDAPTPETFKWQKDDGTFTPGVAITAGVAQTLSDGVQITFTAGVGHTKNEKWEVEAIAPQIDAKLSADGKTLSIRDHSNYLTNTQAGHAETAFKDYRRLYITPLNGTKIDINAISAIKPHYGTSAANSDVITHAISADDVLELKLVTVPTWAAGTYTINMCVISGGVFYKAKTTTTQTPSSTATQWDIVTEDNLAAAYFEISTIALIYRLNKLRDEQVHAYYDNYAKTVKDTFFNDEKSIRLFKSFVIMDAIAIAVELGEWNKAQSLLTAGNNIFKIC